uniref:Gas vesicle synthesis GvpLGvpF n=1 Tax=mine drainage metagenome TaxID=410659 RepID=E6PZS5_9ZZZZ
MRKSIRSNQRQFQTNLERLQGRTEMHLKVVVEDCCRELGAPQTSEGVGRAYLTNLRETATRQRERQTRARAVSFQLHRLFSPLDEEISCRLTDNGKMLLDIAHLIDRKCVERYHNKYSAATQMMKECQMQLSGPWPPYHFVQRLTRGAHTASHAPVAPPASTTRLEPVLATV